MRGSKYLSELITDPAHILPGKINLIEANTSAGKTYFALNTLPQWAGTPEKVLYLIDTINGELRLRQNIVAISRLDYELANYGEKEGWGEPIACARGKMPVMTYAGFGAEIKNAGIPFWEKFEYIVCDEIQNLVNYQKMGCENTYRSQKQNKSCGSPSVCPVQASKPSRKRRASRQTRSTNGKRPRFICPRRRRTACYST